MTAADRITQRHQRRYELHDENGHLLDATGARRTAARWLTTYRTTDFGWKVTARLETSYGSERIDRENLERWHAHLDRRHGL